MAAERLSVPWPEEDLLRLLQFLGAKASARLSGVSTSLRRRLTDPVSRLRQSEAVLGGQQDVQRKLLQMEEALSNLEHNIADASAAIGPPSSFAGACENLRVMEKRFDYAMRYVHGPDWELKPGRLITKKGTWLKSTTRFSWEVPNNEKLYVPEGVGIPILQIGRVIDPEEIKLHEWSEQHLRVWMPPDIIKRLEARRMVWFIYWPHWKSDAAPVEGNVAIGAASDTWLKRTTGMSGEMQPFEMIYVPRGMKLTLSCQPEVVDEEWEVNRHSHVHQHRKVTLSEYPTCIRRDKYDILVGQGKV
jgi:hypothetical protein